MSPKRSKSVTMMVLSAVTIVFCLPITAQVVSEYSIPGIAGNVCYGAGAVWFTDAANNAIGSILPDGTWQEWTIPTANSSPAGCAFSSNGELYFTEQAAYKVGEFNTYRNSFAERPTPLPHNGLAGLTFGADGNLWIVAPAESAILHMRPDGVFLPTIKLATGRWPHGPSLCHDGNVWFAENTANRIAKVSVTGVVREWMVPYHDNTSKPFTTACGPDGVYFTLNGSNQVARITYAGIIKWWTLPTAATAPMGIALCDLNSNGVPQQVFVAESNVNKIGVMPVGGGLISEFLTGSLPNKVTCGLADNRAYWSERGDTYVGAMQ